MIRLRASLNWRSEVVQGSQFKALLSIAVVGPVAQIIASVPEVNGVWNLATN